MNTYETELVDAWLKTNRFLTRVGLPNIEGANAILASRTANGVKENLHVLNKVRFIPTSYLCGGAEFNERSEDEIKRHADSFLEKYFKSERIAQARNSVAENVHWIYVLVVGEVRSNYEVEYLRELGIQVINFKEVVNQAILNRSRLGVMSETRRLLSVMKYISAQ